ncbi:MAG: PCMD domain-containing protein [Fibrobacter sp.]|nr:PCMD domain-containing protein [Fibrobacter sp.]
MRILKYCLAVAFVLAGCSADYDTFGESDYNNLVDIAFSEQESSVSVYSGEHRIKVNLKEPEKSTWEFVTLESVNMSHFASLHLVESGLDEFPTDSAACDSLARKVSYSKKELEEGDRVRIPESKIVYLLVVSESGEPSIWKVEFVIPEVKESTKTSSSSKSESSSSGKSDGSSTSKDSSSSKASSSSSGKTESSDSGKDESSSSKGAAAAEAPFIKSLEIAGKAAVLDSSGEGENVTYHFHVDSLGFRTDLADLEVTALELSDGASCDIEPGKKYDFGAGKKVIVKKGDAERVYTVKAGYQLPGSDFDSWKGDNILPDSIWDNANTIVTTTTKYSSGGVVGIKMETNVVLTKVASGSAYTAVFNPNGVGTLSMANASTWPDGNELINFGKKFAARPEYVEFTFSYEGKGDSCDLYVLLENRTGDGNVNRTSSDVNTLVASAWYRSETADNTGRENPDVVYVSEKDANGMRTVRLKFAYGKPREGSPIENSSVFATSLQSREKKAIDNSLVEGDGSNGVTHIRVVMASSAAGNFYEGTKGAQLIVDKMRLIY